MTIAEINGKLNPQSPSVLNSEDILTSDFFGTIKYLKPEKLLIPFLKRSINVSNEKIAINKITDFKIYFWPKFFQNREPDIVLVLNREEVITVIMVECKLYAGKSNIDIKDPNLEFTGDQLADQFLLLRNKELIKKEFNISSDYEWFNLYITANANFPMEDIEESIQKLKNKGFNEDCCRSKFYWNNWQNGYETVLEILNKLNDKKNVEYLLLDDLKSLLEKKRLFYYRGFKNYKLQRKEIFKQNKIFWMIDWWNYNKPNIKHDAKNIMWEEHKEEVK
ncbi:MAG: hypothetical protein PWQ96_1302 [Clostridia bacterium]|jgi:hypothetical protein|nr:hypothetical protein [Clostridiales bacterium]MDK2985660.1 hypothetical protein [Clostridia bacterium]